MKKLFSFWIEKALLKRVKKLVDGDEMVPSIAHFIRLAIIKECERRERRWGWQADIPHLFSNDKMMEKSFHYYVP